MTSTVPPTDAATLERTLRERRFGPPDPGAVTPWDFIYEWPDAYVRDRVWPVISKLLVDGDPILRARSIEFIRDWRDGQTATTPRLIEAAERNTALFAEQDAEGVTLREMMAHALANRAPFGDRDRIAGALKKLTTDAPVGSGAAGIVACFDPQFAATKAKQWGDRAAEWSEDAATSLALYRRDELIPFLRALTQLSDDIRERILRGVEKYIKRDDAVATGIAKRDGFPPPTKPAPTPQDCRQAIGLG